MDNFKSEMSFFLRKLRDRAEMNQVQAGQILHSSRRPISKIENGVREPSIQELFQLLSGYDMPVIYGVAYLLSLFQTAGYPLRNEDSRLLKGIGQEMIKSGHLLPATLDEDDPL